MASKMHDRVKKCLKWVVKALRIHKHEKNPLLSKLTVIVFTAANQIHR